MAVAEATETSVYLNLASVVLLFLTFLAAVSAARAARDAAKAAQQTVDLSHAMVVEGEKATAAALEAAKGAERQANISEETAQRQLRPYIGVHAGQIKHESGTETFQVHIELRNSGQPPAHGFTCWVDAQVLNSQADPPPFQEVEATDRGIVLHPSGSSHIYRSVDGFGYSAYIDIPRRCEMIFIWGEATYLDPISGEKRRFRFRRMNSHVHWNGTFDVRPHPLGDDAD